MLLNFVGIALILATARTAQAVDGSLQCTREGAQCADCNTAQFCERVGDRYVEVNQTVCPPETPYCDAATGTCEKDPDDNCLNYQCKSAGPFCLSCHMAVMCAPISDGLGYYKAWNLTCPPEAPFCRYETGTCSPVMDDVCGQSDTNFICFEDGYFPSATNCSEYHVCTKFIPRKFSCPAGLNYNPDKKMCDSSDPCAMPDCPAGDYKGKFVPFKDYPSYFNYCNGTESVATLKCEGNYEMNFTEQACDAHCKKPGLIPVPSDCTKYNKCYYDYVNDTERFLIKEVKSCPEGFEFEPSEFQCVPRELSTCKPYLSARFGGGAGNFLSMLMNIGKGLLGGGLFG